MIVTHEIKMDLTQGGEFPVLEAVQDDKYSRNLKLNLFFGNLPWLLPEGTTGIIRFCKPDGKGGEYDTLPDGQGAFSISENVVDVALAPQVLTVAGLVQLEICLTHADSQLTTFRLLLNVQPNLKAQLMGSEDYYCVEELLRRSGWVPDMFLGTDEEGNVVEVPAPECKGTTEEEVLALVETYLEENPQEGNITDEKLAEAIETYLTENPMGGGATAEQLAQIEQNSADIAALPVSVDSDGYTDIEGLRQVTSMAFSKSESTITLIVTLQGGGTSESVMTINSDDYPTKIVTDGTECTVTWEGFDG